MEVLISWGGYVFHTCRHVPNRPMREVLMVINLPPPHFGKGSFITVHGHATFCSHFQKSGVRIKEVLFHFISEDHHAEQRCRLYANTYR